MTVTALLESTRSPRSPTTVIGPEPAVVGTSTVIDAAVLVAMLALAPPLKSTAVARLRWVPVIVSGAPPATVAGDTAATVIACATVICTALSRATPSTATTLSAPPVASAGTSSARLVAERAAMASTAPLSRICCTRSRSEPFAVTRPGATTVAGETAFTCGTRASTAAALFDSPPPPPQAVTSSAAATATTPRADR
jgi:hypothetical protein